ncbi:hypothetical protein [sulfur-oxidizing endosymbiont of Gigantopelta aegis]|uniref:hypothetical protein n=1 Tax=sulfur-oxidizing endosymbiont of Gigantopelta aegis TaxID=2794934 RepID=UPI0018DC04B6|nr:hypothetical protein [sulfur-oxidizing endosymbiont of Gigantopelta aegis]
MGDWQQGLTTIKLPRNSEFDFIYKWHINDVAHTATLKNISCTADSLAENNLMEEKE